MNNTGIGEPIQWDGITVATARGLRDRYRGGLREGFGEMPGRHQVAGAARARRMGVAPHFVLPIGDVTIAIERGACPGHHGRSEWLPGMLLLAHPLHTHR